MPTTARQRRHIANQTRHRRKQETAAQRMLRRYVRRRRLGNPAGRWLRCLRSKTGRRLGRRDAENHIVKETHQFRRVCRRYRCQEWGIAIGENSNRQRERPLDMQVMDSPLGVESVSVPHQGTSTSARQQPASRCWPNHRRTTSNRVLTAPMSCPTVQPTCPRETGSTAARRRRE